MDNAPPPTEKHVWVRLVHLLLSPRAGLNISLPAQKCVNNYHEGSKGVVDLYQKALMPCMEKAARQNRDKLIEFWKTETPETLADCFLSSSIRFLRIATGCVTWSIMGNNGLFLHVTHRTYEFYYGKLLIYKGKIRVFTARNGRQVYKGVEVLDDLRTVMQLVRHARIITFNAIIHTYDYGNACTCGITQVASHFGFEPGFVFEPRSNDQIDLVVAQRNQLHELEQELEANENTDRGYTSCTYEKPFLTIR
ncbi:unnamed protein product [Caenorhabditis sp. 36 PRJEB53466]|nr:unnamed protein product [Caenorhabditis sp. 36 PRJEB53466]